MERSQVNHNSNRSHKTKLEALYQDVRFPEAIDWWAAHYAENEMDVAISNARHLDPCRQAIENNVWRRIVPANGMVLDLACGRGFFSGRLRHNLGSSARVIGLDLSETILRVARAEQKGIPFVLGTAENLPFAENIFDAAMLISAVEQMENPGLAIMETLRVLKPRGYLYLCIHKPFLDPLVFPSVAQKILRLIKEPAWRDGSRENTEMGYQGTLRELRRSLQNLLPTTKLQWVESRTLLHQLEWKLYKSVVPWAVPGLIRMGQFLNRLPFRHYKNLEYWLLQKP